MLIIMSRPRPVQEFRDEFDRDNVYCSEFRHFSEISRRYAPKRYTFVTQKRQYQ